MNFTVVKERTPQEIASNSVKQWHKRVHTQKNTRNIFNWSIKAKLSKIWLSLDIKQLGWKRTQIRTNSDAIPTQFRSNSEAIPKQFWIKSESYYVTRKTRWPPPIWKAAIHYSALDAPAGLVYYFIHDTYVYSLLGLVARSSLHLSVVHHRLIITKPQVLQVEFS